MSNPKKKIEYKPKVSPDWERLVTDAINGHLNVSFYPKDGEIYIPLDTETGWSVVLKKNGTWTIA